MMLSRINLIERVCVLEACCAVHPIADAPSDPLPPLLPGLFFFLVWGKKIKENKERKRKKIIKSKKRGKEEKRK